jgi:hypothetical protein
MNAAFIPLCVAMTCDRPSLPGEIHCQKCDEHYQRTKDCCLSCELPIPAGYRVSDDCPHCGSGECGLEAIEAQCRTLQNPRLAMAA